VKRPLPNERPSVTHRFQVGDTKCYITVGMSEDGQPREVFLVSNKVGSTERGLLHCLAIMMSLALQNGIPLEVITGKLIHMRFEPSGMTGNPRIPMAKSIADYVAHWLDMKFGKECQRCQNDP